MSRGEIASCQPANGGYVQLWRRLSDNPVWTQLSPAVLKVMLGCLFRANWRPATWYDGHKQVQIPRGSFITSYGKMAEFCNLSVKQIRLAFAHLENLGFMACTRAQRWTLVTIVKYDTYQCSPEEEGTPEGSIGAGKGQDEGRQRATTEEVNKGININTPFPPEGAGADAPLELVSPEPKGKPVSKRKPYQDTLEQVARTIHERHPNTDGASERRNVTVAGVARKLAAILKYRRVPVAECEAYLRRAGGRNA